MAYHDRKLHGAMLQKTFTTRILNDSNVEEHDKKVNDFNKEKIVWFNTQTSCPAINGIGFDLITTCLYTEQKDQGS
jgi:hypothetical protein